jgi:DNA-binding winged helix-turn-helix (wHTH) protein/tetratricopeptide (TPR) repeat protein
MPTETLLRLGACEVDLDAREVRIQGRPRRIEPRAFQLLACLAQHRHRVVTKRELLDTVWPGQQVSDAALARAVMKARQAIGDTGAPALIRTVPRVGYRLVSDAGDENSPTLPASPASAAEPTITHPSSPRDPLRIALLPIENATNDGALEWVELGLMSLVMHSLGQDPRLSPVAMPALLTVIDGARLSPQADLEATVRNATGAQTVVHARLTLHRDGYQIGFRATGPREAHGSATARTPAELGPQLAQALEERLFPHQATSTLQGLDSEDPLAIGAFARGLQAIARQKYPQAVNLLKVALDLAPGSTAVELELLRALGGMGDLEAGQTHARRLLACAERTGDLMLAARVHLAMGRMHLNRSAFVPAAFRIEKGLRLMGAEGPLDERAAAELMRSQIAAYTQDTGRMEQALEHLRQLCERSGNRVLPLSRLNMLAVAAWNRGDCERAAELSARAARQARELHAHRVVVTAGANSAEYLTLLGRWGEAAAHAEEAFAAALLLDDPVSICLAAYGACWIHRLARNAAASERVVAALPPAERLAALPREWATQARAHHAAAVGQHAEAARLFAQTLERLREGDNRLNEQEVLPWYVCALVQCGRLDEAEAELAASSGASPRDHPEFRYWMSHCRALLAHAGGRSAHALEALSALASGGASPLWRAWACIDAAWLLAEAGRADEARAVLQQLPPHFRDHPLCDAVSARLRFIDGDAVAAWQLHRRYLQAAAGPVTAPGYFESLATCYAKGQEPPRAPCLPSRL